MKLRYIFIAFIGAILATSCTENIDFPVETEQERIVVEGMITNKKQKHLIKLTKTTSFFEEDDVPAIENANVEITDGTNTYLCIEEGPGEYYTPDMAFPVETNYTLKVDYDGTVYEGSDYMNEVMPIDTIATFERDEFDFEEGILRPYATVVLFATEKEGLGDYYLWKYQVQKPDTAEKDMTPTYKDWTFASDEFVDGNSPADGWPIFDRIEPYEIVSGSTVRVQMFGISKAYYEFLDAIGKAVYRGGLFDGPPANVATNMNNGALGFFVAASVSEGQTVKE